MKRILTPAVSLFAGMIIAQVLFTVFVYSSDNDLYKNLMAMQAAGYHVLVPNEQVMPTLEQWKPAFCGGLFFTLTAGAGLSLAGWFAVFLWQIFPKHRRIIFGVFLASAGYVLFRLNDHGFNLPVTVICLLIPAISGSAAFKNYAKHPMPPDFHMVAMHMAVIAMIAMIWMPKVNADVFTTIRDHLLLTSSLGRKINDFYYHYTLYPAETFKSLDQKMLKTVNIAVQDKGLSRRLANCLLDADYLPVPVAAHQADLTMTAKDNRLIFQNNGQRVHTSAVSAFFNSPEEQLTAVSKNSDRQHFFRKMTFISLIAASPLFCYILLNAFFTLLLLPVPSVAVRSGCAALLCLMAAGIAAIPLYKDAANKITASDIRRYLSSDRWQDRVNALKYLSDNEIPIDGFNGIFKMLDSPWIAERYWLAKATGNSRSMESGRIALTLLNDAQPNVVCMALFSLGNGHQPMVIPEIINKINTSYHWYVQWYGYKALKRLGWRRQIGQEFRQ